MACIPGSSYQIPGWGDDLTMNTWYKASGTTLTFNETTIEFHENRIKLTGARLPRDAAYALIQEMLKYPYHDSISYGGIVELKINPKIGLMLAVKTGIHRKTYRRFKAIKEQFDELKTLVIFS